MHFKIDWAFLIVGSKSTVLDLFYFVFEGIFPSTNPARLILGGGGGGDDLTEGFLCYRFGEIIF